jgi:hypothetical protein
MCIRRCSAGSTAGCSDTSRPSPPRARFTDCLDNWPLLSGGGRPVVYKLAALSKWLSRCPGGRVPNGTLRSAFVRSVGCTSGCTTGHLAGACSCPLLCQATGLPLLTPRDGQGVWVSLGRSGVEQLTSANVGRGSRLSGRVCEEWLPSLAPARSGMCKERTISLESFVIRLLIPPDQLVRMSVRHRRLTAGHRR